MRRRAAPISLRRTDDERAVGAIENDRLATMQHRQRAAQAHHGGQAQRACQDGHVRGGGARLGGDGGDALAVELQRERRREIVRDENGVRSARHVHRIVIGQMQQDGQHTDVHVHQVAHLFAQHGRAVAGEVLTPFEQHEVERLFGAEVLPHERRGAVHQLLIVEDRELYVEDAGFFGTGLHFRAGAERAQTFTRLLDGFVQARDFGLDLAVVDEPMANLRHLPAQEMHRTHDDSR